MIETMIRDEATPISGAIKGGQASAPRLHAARLVGSYHAYKGAGDPAMFAAWLNTLGANDLLFIRAYRTYNEPGRLDVEPATIEGLVMGVAMGFALGNAPPAAKAQLDAFEAAAQAAAQLGAMGYMFDGAMQNLNAAFAQMGAGIVDSVGPGLVAGGAGAIKRVEELYETIERVELAEDLRAAYVPGPMADWLAQNWPAWAIPRRMRARVGGAWAWLQDTVRGWLWPTY